MATEESNNSSSSELSSSCRQRRESLATSVTTIDNNSTATSQSSSSFSATDNVVDNTMMLPIHNHPPHSSCTHGGERYSHSRRVMRNNRKQHRRQLLVSTSILALIMISVCYTANQQYNTIRLLKADRRYSQQQQHTSPRHPLSFPKKRRLISSSSFRRRTRHEGERSTEKLRILTLGGSNTWGEGLEDPESQAYPYLLSSQVHNAAQKGVDANSATIASLCTQSIVGSDEVYDVIVLEFEPSTSLELLAQRLRRRFPLAELVFVHLGKKSQNNNQDDEDDERRALNSIVEATKGKLYQLPKSNNDDDVSSSALLSSDGQQIVADGIRSLLLDHRDNIQREENLDKAVVLGDWGDGDLCQIWYDTGLGLPKRSKNLALNKFANNGKYAMEVPFPTSSYQDDGSSSSLTITNPFQDQRIIYLTYMATDGVGISNKIYPRTKVQIAVNNDDEHDEQHTSSSIVLDPYVADENGHHRKHVVPSIDTDQRQHMTRTSAIGMIPPGGGPTKMTFNPMENTVSNFRLVGISLLPTSYKTSYKIPIEYDLCREPAYVPEAMDVEPTLLDYY